MKCKTIEVYYHAPKKRTLRKEQQRKQRIAAYCRVSTLAEEQDLSFETQCTYYEKLISTEPDKELVGIYGDHGISGLHMKNRDGFLHMLQCCREGKIDTIITKSISRFSRNMSEMRSVLDELKNLGIAVFFEREAIDSLNPNFELYMNILASLAQEESNSMSQAIRWAYEKSAENGSPFRRTCYGYRKKVINGKKTRDWVIYEPEAKHVRLAFDMAAKGRPYLEILKALNSMEELSESPQRWSRPRLRYLLQNEAYKGDLLTHKTLVVDYLTKKQVHNHGEYDQVYIEEHHEAIVSPKQFELVKQRIKSGALRSGRKPYNE